jgi:hypothetical protein
MLMFNAEETVDTMHHSMSSSFVEARSPPCPSRSAFAAWVMPWSHACALAADSARRK